MVCFFHEKACKGTTKNAYVQIFDEKVYFLSPKAALKAALSKMRFYKISARRARNYLFPQPRQDVLISLRSNDPLCGTIRAEVVVVVVLKISKRIVGARSLLFMLSS